MAYEELCPACEKTVTFWERDAKLLSSACGAPSGVPTDHARASDPSNSTWGATLAALGVILVGLSLLACERQPSPEPEPRKEWSAVEVREEVRRLAVERDPHPWMIAVWDEAERKRDGGSYVNEPPKGEVCHGSHHAGDGDSGWWVACPGIKSPGGRTLTADGTWAYRYVETDGRPMFAVRYEPKRWQRYLQSDLSFRSGAVYPGFFLQCRECCEKSEAVFPWEFVKLDLAGK